MNHEPLTVAVVGATGVVGRTMIQVLNEREFPVGELRLLASGDRPAGPCRSTAATLEIGEAVARRLRGRRHRAVLGRRRHLARAGARPPSPAARRSSTTPRRGGWTRRSRSSSRQVNPDDLEGHQGIIANPNCSTMQLVPVLMALRDAVGLERVVVDTYQSVSGTGADALAELETQIRAHVAGEPQASRASTRTRSRSTRCPRSTSSCDNGYTKEEWKVVTESRKILAPAGPAHLVHGGPRPGLRQPLRGGPRRDARPDHARARARAVRRRARASSSRTTRPSIDYPLATEAAGRDEIFVGRVRQRHRPIAGRPRPRVLGRLRQPAQGRGDERGRDRRGPRRARLDRRRAADRARRARRHAAAGARRGDGVTDAERRAALEAIAAEVRACTRCRLHETRTQAVPGEGDPDTEVVFVGEGPGLQRGPRRAGRSSAGPATCWSSSSARSAGGARTCSSPTSSSAGRPTTATREPDEIAACAPYLRRQLEVLDPALVVTLGRFSMGTLHARRADLARPTARSVRSTRRRAPATPWRSRCTTRPPRCGRRPSNARATPTSRRVPAALHRRPRRATRGRATTAAGRPGAGRAEADRPQPRRSTAADAEPGPSGRLPAPRPPRRPTTPTPPD